VRGKPQLLQHLDGGIVKEIDVRNGDRVDKGDVLVRLDDATLKANIDIYTNRLREALARRARLEAERDDRNAIQFDEETVKTLNLGDDTSYRERQDSLFRARKASRTGEVDKLKEQIEQFENQMDGLDGLIGAKTEQLKTVTTELDSLTDLLEKGIVTKTRVYSQERMKSDLTGQIVEHAAEMARMSNAVRETEVSIIQVDRAFKEKVLSELSEAATQTDDLIQQITATRKQLDRVEIRAPVAGVVHELSVNTVGGTIPPNATLMQFIASDGGLDVEVNVEPNSIDQLSIGQEAVLRFPAFNQATTPEIFGAIDRILASSITDEKTGISFYRVIMSVTPEEMARLKDLRLIPGMPVEAFVRTGQRTDASFLMKPFTDNLSRALRE
jgi:HlyD family secretion protein